MQKKTAIIRKPWEIVTFTVMFFPELQKNVMGFQSPHPHRAGRNAVRVEGLAPVADSSGNCRRQNVNVGRLKFIAGAVLSRLLPGRTRVIREAFTLPYFDVRTRGGILDRLIRFYLAESVKTAPQELEALHRGFWARQGAEGWHGATLERSDREYLPAYSDLARLCTREIDSRDIERVVELGTGNGDWLKYLSRQWHRPRTFIGIDIAQQQIETSQARHPDLVFHWADMTKWVEEEADSRTLFVTQGGVLEYLSEDSVRDLFAAVKLRCPDSLLFLIEPLAKNHNLGTDLESRLYGSEYSYSHNYPFLLQQGGFSLLNQEERTVLDHRWLVILAAV